MMTTPERCSAREEAQTDPARLVELLYQRALCDLRNAAELWPRAAPAGQLVAHAQAILKQLQASLNHAQGGVLAVNLGRLYEHLQLRLAEVAAGQSDDPPARITEVIGLLEALSDAWSIMANRASDGPAASTLVRESTLVA